MRKNRRGSTNSIGSEASEASISSFSNVIASRGGADKQCAKELLRASSDPSTHPHRLKPQLRQERHQNLQAIHDWRGRSSPATDGAPQMVPLATPANDEVEAALETAIMTKALHGKENNSSFEEQQPPMNPERNRSGGVVVDDDEEDLDDDPDHDQPSGGRSSRLAMNLAFGQRKGRKSPAPVQVPKHQRVRSWEETLPTGFL